VRLALKILVTLVALTALIAGGILVALNGASTATEQAGKAKASIAPVHREIMQNRQNIARNRQLIVRTQQTVIRSQRVVLQKAIIFVKREIGRTGRTGKAGAGAKPVTLAIVRAAVDSLCSQQACSSPVTLEQLAAAMRLCVQDGSCAALKGAKGDAGKDGESAPPVTEEQLSGVHAMFCAMRDNCRGPVGPQGPQGPPVGSFAFTDATGQQQSCADPEGDGSYVCTVVVPVPPPESPAP
jgi:hypothetical protein